MDNAVDFLFFTRSFRRFRPQASAEIVFGSGERDWECQKRSLSAEKLRVKSAENALRISPSNRSDQSRNVVLTGSPTHPATHSPPSTPRCSIRPHIRHKFSRLPLDSPEATAVLRQLVRSSRSIQATGDDGQRDGRTGRLVNHRKTIRNGRRRWSRPPLCSES